MANKVLIVDDESDILKTLSVRLQSSGYEVAGSTNGQEALGLARQFMPDMILLDVMMPGMDGLEVKAQLNEDLLTASTPVIFLSAGNATSVKLKALGLGADDYMVKPFASEELLARMKAVLDKKRYYEKLAMTDGLTGLYNQAFFKKQLALFFSSAKRYKKIFSVIMIDMDGFKVINDKYGHTAGDNVLKEFSSIAGQILRTSDVVARYGGDEFAILLPETDRNMAQIVLKRLRDKIGESAIPIAHSDEKVTFSISAGVVTYDADHDNAIDLFDHCDKELYEDKKGKNQPL